MVRIYEAKGAGDITKVRALFAEYQQALGVDLCFQGFAEELTTLPGNYDCLLIAAEGDTALGCVGLRPCGQDGEMKRLYVRPEGRGRGIGRLLVNSVLERARQGGYPRVVLDTLPQMAEARALYRSLGFREIPAYYENPIPGTAYLALALSA